MVKRRNKKRGGGDEVAKKFPTTKKEFLRALENNIHLEKEVNLALKKARNSKIKIKMPNNFDEMLKNIKKNKNVDKILKKMGEVYSKIIKQRKRRVQKKKIRGGGDGDDDDEGDGAEKNGGDDDDDDDSNIDYENLDIGGPDSQVCYRAAFTKWALLVAGGTAVGGALIYGYMTLPSATETAVSATALAQFTGSTITSVQRLADDAGIDSEAEVMGTVGVAAILAYLAASKEVFKPIIDSISSILGGGRDGSLLFVTYLIVNDYCKCMRKKQSSLEPEGREDYRNKCDEKKNFINEVYHIYAILADLLPGFTPMPKEFRQRKIPNIIRIIQQRFGTIVHPPLDSEGDHVLGGMEVNNRGVAINRLVAQNQGELATIPTEAQIQAQMGRERRVRAAEARRLQRLRRRRPVNNNNNNNQQQQMPQILRQRSVNPQGEEQPEQKSDTNLRLQSMNRPQTRRAKTHVEGGGRRKTKRRRKVKKTKKRKMKKRKRKTNKKRRRTKRK